MTCIADANVLFPLLVQGHAAYEVAKAWWDEQPDGTVGTCLLTRLAVLRLWSNRVAMNGAPVGPDDALKAWHRLSDDPRSFHIDAEPADHEPRFVSLVSSREPTCHPPDGRRGADPHFDCLRGRSAGIVSEHCCSCGRKG